MDSEITIDGIPGNYKDEITDEQVNKSFDENWKDIVTNPDGSINLGQIKKELYDYTFLMKNASEVYCDITGGKLSKTNYYSSVIISEADENYREIYQKEIDELSQEIEKLQNEKGKKPERFCFESDGDCHNFLIPLSKRELFEKLKEQGEDDEYEAFNDEFSEYMIDGIEGCYSFEKVEEMI